MKYRREIDGLRALAVIPVILFHAGFKAFSGGFVGVDVFFVISGYLITSIILAEKSAGTFSLTRFYERRARRILPALFLVMATCLPFAWAWLLPEDMEKFAQSVAAVSVFASNILFYLTRGYFETAAELNPLLHTWSLAVEEQYYVLFPLFLLLAWKWGTRWTAALLAVAAILSLGAAQWGSKTHPIFTYFLLPTRGWELLIGALAAFYYPPLFLQSKGENSAINQLLSAIGLSMIAYAVYALDKDTPYPSLYTLLPAIGAALILVFCTQQTLLGKLLGSKLFVGVGLISYSAYLWHQPLFAFARHRSLQEPGVPLYAALIMLSLLLAYVSWKYVETPFRNIQRIKRRQVFAGAAIGSLAFIAFGLAGILSAGYPSRFDSGFLASIKEITLAKINNGYCFYSVDTIKTLPVGEKGLHCLLGDKAAGKKGLLFGDSFAGQYEPFWDRVASENSLAINSVATNWCYPAFTTEFATGKYGSRAYPQCLINRQFLLDKLSEYDFIILAGRWSEVAKIDNLKGTIDVIKAAAAKSKLVIVMASPKEYDQDLGYLYKKILLREHGRNNGNLIFTTESDAAEKSANEKLAEVARNYPNVLFIDRETLFNTGVSSDVTKEGYPYSSDGFHISIYGAKMAAINFMHSKIYREFQMRLSQIKQ